MRILPTLIMLARSRVARRGVIAGSVLFAIAVSILGARHFASAGWPLAHGNAPLLAAAGAIFVVAFGVKGAGWRRMFAKGERPGSHALAAAGGAAAVTGLALPGRFDDAVRVAVVRRFGGRAGLGAICLSVVTVGFLDAVALTPFAAVAAGLSHSPTGIRVGLALVAGAGVGAGLVLLAAPHLGGVVRLARFRVVRWLNTHCHSTREAGKAWLIVSLSWSLRAVALYLLLLGLGISSSFALALLFLSATAASTALPVAPAGAATQAGVGAAVLALAGVHVSQAIAFAVAAQTLIAFAGAAVVVGAGAWEARLRFAAARA